MGENQKMTAVPVSTFQKLADGMYMSNLNTCKSDTVIYSALKEMRFPNGSNGQFINGVTYAQQHRLDWFGTTIDCQMQPRTRC